MAARIARTDGAAGPVGAAAPAMVRVEQVGLQCYTIRDHCKTEADFTESMAKAAKIGARRPPFIR